MIISVWLILFVLSAAFIAACYLAMGAVVSSLLVSVHALFSRETKGIAPVIVAIFILIPFVSAAIFAAHVMGWPRTSWHYRMTIEIETPEGIKKGTAVREVVYGGRGLLGRQWKLKCNAEAVAVDLGKHGVVFALTQGNVMGRKHCAAVLLVALPPSKKMKKETLSLDRLPPEGQKVILSPHAYPMFVRFRDLNDPVTVENVTKNDKGGYLLDGEKLGDGIKLKEITIEMTDDPVASGEIEKWLPWIGVGYDARKYERGENAMTVTWDTSTKRILIRSDFVKDAKSF